MGFLTRIFSIGSKKGKRRPHIVEVDSELRGIREEEEHEATVGRLLRSSSTRYAVVSEIDYTSLPPLPHPINEVIQTPAASTVSLASTSISHRGTYNVTVHKRKQHTLTEFPNANRDLDDCFTTPRRNSVTPNHPKDNIHLLGLRSDPSVASLLDMYDEHGCISIKAFSNSPPSPQKAGRAQTQRSGSTLRQLLGNPSSLNSRGNDATEGDISWAERFLGETGSASSTSSLGAPHTPDTLFHDTNLPRSHIHDTTLTSDHDLSAIENPAISSMEVELSNSLPSFDYPSKDRYPRETPNPTTPRRASQVFAFLTSKRSPVNQDVQDNSLPELPSTSSTSSNEGSLPNEARHARYSSDGSFESAFGSLITSAIPKPYFDDHLSFPQTNFTPTQSACPSTYLPSTSLHPMGSLSRKISNLQLSSHGEQSAPEGITHHEVKVIMTGPTKVIVTAPTPFAYCETSSRIPRGPRAPYRRSSAGGTKMQQLATLTERSNSHSGSIPLRDMYTPIQRRRKAYHRRSSRRSSSTISNAEIEPPAIRPAEMSSTRRRGGRSILAEFDKENGTGLSVKSDMPYTPLRSKSATSARESRSLFRAAVDPSMFCPPIGTTPSPASSSELSPVGRQLMMNLRHQRMRARDADREKSRRGSSRVVVKPRSGI